MAERDGAEPGRPTSGRSRRVGATLPPEPAQVGVARHLVADALAGLAPSDVRALVLAVSEMVTNAIVHGSGPVGLDLDVDVDRSRAHVTVSDAGGGAPALRPPFPVAAAPGGWGLHVVAQVSDRWGTHSEPGRTVVWMTRDLER